MRSYLYLNYVCNCDCLFCASDETNMKISKKELTIEDVKKFMEYNQDRNEIFINGGEPTVHKDFLKIVKLVKQKYKIVSLATNAIKFSDEEFLQETLESGLEKIVIPLYSLDKNEHDYIVQRKNAFKDVINGLENIDKLSRHYKLFVNIKMLVSGLTYKNNPEIVRFVDSNFKNIRNMSLYGLHIGAKVLANKEACFIDFATARPYITRTIDELLQKNFYFHLDHIPLCGFDNRLLEPLFERQAIAFGTEQIIKRPDKGLFKLVDPYYKAECCSICDVEHICPKMYGKNADRFDYGLRPLKIKIK